MGKYYERSRSDRRGPNGKKLYREEYIISRGTACSPELFRHLCYIDSVWYPGYEAVNTVAAVCVLSLTQSGGMRYSSEWRGETAEPGDFVISRTSDGGGRCRAAGEKPVCRKVAHFWKTQFTDTLLTALFPEPRTIIRLKEPERLSLLLDLLKSAMLADSPDMDSAAHGIIFQILGEARRQMSGSQLPAELERALQVISAAADKKISRDDIAARCGVSARTLTRLFHENFNLAPAQYIMKKRLERAKNMLSLHRLSVKEIADFCGFCSAAHLSRMFKKEYGAAPLSHRRNSGERPV